MPKPRLEKTETFIDNLEALQVGGLFSWPGTADEIQQYIRLYSKKSRIYTLKTIEGVRHIIRLR